MGDINGGDTEFIMQAADFEAHFLPQIGIEVRERFIQQQHGGLHHNGAGQRHTLLLAAGKLGRVAPRQVAHFHHIQNLSYAALYFIAGEFAECQPKADIFRHRHIRPNGIGLENHGHAAPFRRQHGTGGGKHLAIDRNHPRIGFNKAGNHAQRCGLAAAGRAEQRQEFPFFERQINRVHNNIFAIGLCQARKGQARHFNPSAT